ncbi:MAG: hypothetical protein LC774_08265, partial [Acidobacteria bacterium]|nr:hypothetical protein [Acidobacteriota bacterium]
MRRENSSPLPSAQSRTLRHVAHLLLLAVIACGAASPAAAQERDQFRVDYTVEVASTSPPLFHVTADVKNLRDSQLDLSLPTWTPGWYTVENYAKNILRFKVTGSTGKPLSHRMTRGERLAPMLAKIVEAQRAVFNDLPYEKYVYFYFFAPAESNADGGLEHNNSHVAVGVGSRNPEPEQLTGLASHEFFHTWNVKRLRPAEMWPYDYSREQETPSLWVSEGFTNYYGSLSNYRASLRRKEEFLQSVAGAAGGVEGNDARGYISPSDASTSTWL